MPRMEAVKRCVLRERIEFANDADLEDFERRLLPGSPEEKRLADLRKPCDVVVRFARNDPLYGAYPPGQLAAFPREEAYDLQRRGAAVIVDPYDMQLYEQSEKD
ncbi:MAG: hypothetical protein MJA29_11700 [Candidatus Omnitrophica bacterium]|nr:hypothetical protein [Candidatus Omnitrophota bacterium]